MAAWVVLALVIGIGVIWLMAENNPSDVQPGEPNYYPGPDPTGAFLLAVQVAEGSDPAWNNPWDLTADFGFPTTGTANDAGVLMFDTLNHGWGAARAQLNDILTGNSSYYTPGTTLSEMGATFTGSVEDGANWAANVAKSLGTSVSNTIGNILNGQL
jgi:hypothetical protein